MAVADVLDVFDLGIATSKNYVQWVVSNQKQDWVTPKKYLLENGQEFLEPKVISGIPGKYKMQECFSNAYKYAQKHNVQYFEGVATNIIPTEHAWCVAEDGTIIDPTWKQGKDYFGVPISLSTLEKIQLITRRYGVLDFWGKEEWDRVLTALNKGKHNVQSNV